MEHASLFSLHKTIESVTDAPNEAGLNRALFFAQSSTKCSLVIIAAILNLKYLLMKVHSLQINYNHTGRMIPKHQQ